MRKIIILLALILLLSGCSDKKYRVMTPDYFSWYCNDYKWEDDTLTLYECNRNDETHVIQNPRNIIITKND